MGGATSGTFHVSLMFLSTDGNESGALPPVAQRPWSTISHSINCRTSTPALRAGPAGDLDPTQRVVRLADGSVGAWGLYPVESVHSAVVTMESAGSASKFLFLKQKNEKINHTLRYRLAINVSKSKYPTS